MPLVSRFPFPEGAELLGVDMPGLHRTLMQVHSLQAYTEALLQPADDPANREELGEATRRNRSFDSNCFRFRHNRLLEFEYGVTVPVSRVTQIGGIVFQGRKLPCKNKIESTSCAADSNEIS
jgi:hypothetical protein